MHDPVEDSPWIVPGSNFGKRLSADSVVGRVRHDLFYRAI